MAGQDDDLALGAADFAANPTQPVVPRLRDSLYQGVQRQPDTEAAVRQYSRRLGLDPITVAEDKDSQHQAKALALDPNGMVRGSPKTANWMSEPDNAAIAHDDVPTLQSIEQTLTNLKDLGKSSAYGFVSGGIGYMQAMDPYLKKIGINLDFGLGTPGDETSQIGKTLVQIRQATKAKSDALMPKTDNPWAAGVNAGIVSLAQNGPMVAAAVISRNPGLAIGGAAAMTGGQAYGEARDKGLSPGRARTYAGIQGGIEAATEFLPMEALVGDYIKHSGIATTVMHQLLTDVPGEQIATLGQDFTEWAMLNPDRPFSDFVAERPSAAISTLVASGVGVAGHASLNAATNAIVKTAQRNEPMAQAAQAAQTTAETIVNLSKAAEASALRQRDPTTFQQYVEAVTQDTPVESVYINANDLVDVLAQGSPEKLTENTAVLDAMPSVGPQLQDAIASGGLIQIPTAELLAWTPETSLGQAILEHLKVDPNAMSMAEATAFMQTQAEGFKAEVSRTMEGDAQAQVFAASAEAVRSNIQGQLDTANRFTADVNQAYASFIASFYSTQAQRLGQSPEDVFAAHPLTVQAQGVQTGELVNQEAAAKPELPSFKAFASSVASTSGLDRLSVSETSNGDLRVDMMRAPTDEMGQGRGTAAMERLAAYADAAGKRMVLSPAEPSDGIGTTSKKRLTDFYKRFGFRPNAGRSRDLAVSDAMVREPQALTPERAALLGAVPQPTASHWTTDAQTMTLPDRASVLLTTEQVDALSARMVDGLALTGEHITPGELSAARDGASAVELLEQKNYAYAQWLVEQGQQPDIREGLDYGEQRAALQQQVAYLGDEALRDYYDWAASIIGDQSLYQDAPPAPQVLDQGNKKLPRGSFNPQTNVITLLRDADLSTFLHESGHFFLETMAKMASDPAAPQELLDDWAKAANFLGVPDVAPEAWLATPIDERRDGHEKWARGVEAYLREGKAPSAQLQPLFQKFKAWLLHVYESLAKLKVELTDEVRGVFDRLLASQDEIDRAQRLRMFDPVFTAKPDSMTDMEWEAYQALGQQATLDAQDALEARSVRDMRWLQNARMRMIRKLAAEAKEKRKALRDEVTAEVYAMPVYAAERFLRRGEFNGGQAEGMHKLETAGVAAYYEGTPQEIQDWRKLGFGRYGMLAEDGLNPDHVAELFGFTSGNELVETLLNAEPVRDVIEGLTDKRMLERYGDLKDEASIAKAADEAIHNDARLRFVATEANALSKAVGRASVLAEAARDFAKELVGRQRIRDLRPGKYTGAETRAAASAARAAAKGDLNEAASQKRSQLINGYAAKAAFEAQAEVEKALRLFDRLQGKGAQKNIDPEYRDQIDALLARFDLRKGESLKAIDKRKSLANWITAMQERGLDPVISDELKDEAFRKHYRDMTMDEMRGLVDAIKNIVHLGRLKNRLLVAAQGRAFQAVVDEAEALIRGQAYKTLPVKLESNTWTDKFTSGVANFFAIHRKFSSLIREMSGLDTEGGVLWRAFIQPLNAANDREAAMREQATLRLAEVFQTLTVKPGELRRKLFIPAIENSLSLEGRLAVALNWGNDLNRARIMDGDKWTPDQAMAVMQALSAEQLQFVNAMWEYLDSYWPEIAAKERRVTGVEPEKVAAEPFQIRSADGQIVDMRGGYYPIKYDTARSSRSESDEIAENVKAALRGAYTAATTRRGHTKARVDKVERPVRKDLMVPFQHVNQVIHDLAFHEYLIDANRLIKNAQLDAAVRDHYGPEVLKTIKHTLDDIAEGDATAENALERAMNYIRTGTSIVGLGWNLMTGLLQPLGLTQSIVRIGPKYVAKGIGRAFADAATLQNTVEAIGNKSEFMRLRAKTFMREINEVQNRVQDSLKPPFVQHMEASYFALIQKLQLIADVPTWLGAYAKAQAAGHDDTTAVALADQAVRDSQGGGQIGDLAEIQRGGVWLKLWTNFYSFFNIGYNQMAESLAETRRVGPSRLPLLAADVALVAILPSVLGELLKHALRGDDWDWEELGPQLAKSQLSFLLGFMVGLRDATAAGDLVLAASGADVGPSTNKGPSSLRLFTQDLPQLATQVGQGVQTGDWEGVRKPAINTAGVLLHFPAAQVNRTIDGFEAMAKGETKNPTALLAGPPRKK